METKTTDKRFYMDVLKGQECQCGAWKRPGLAFCYVCNQKLSSDMREDLRSPIGNGFEDAYEDAVKYLSD